MKTFRFFLVSLVCSCLVFITGDANAQVKDNNPIQGTYKSIYDMLKDVPGLEVTSNNGRGGTVTIRGKSSLNSQAQPLFVLDGMVYSGDIASLNPQDIAGISVLKDAASATAYGSRGMAGVIVITTKTGTMSYRKPDVETHEESAYTYFINKKTPLRIFGLNDDVIVEGVIQRQQDSTLVFIKKRKELLVPLNKIKRVEMMPVDN